jgi:valyl-tRNA synthetase
MEKSYDFLGSEEQIYKKWENSGFFNPDKLGLSPDAKAYTIVLPPPNVTGTLHVGHAGVLTFEDILIRYHRMKGERALWVPGTDHAAIATQTKVEKIIREEGLSRHELGREKFLERVRQFAQDSHDTIVGQCKRMGASLDWSREAYTLDETRNKAVNSVFKLMYDDGLIFRGERIVNWCPRCHSTISDDEVEYKENRTKLYFFKYSKDFPITIATTRPETKLGDTAVAVNPKDERYRHLVGQEYEVDFVGVKLKIKIIADRGIDMAFGTGALGVTPAHSAVDWQMAEANQLPIVKVIDEDGLVHPGFGEYSDLSAKEAQKKVIEKIQTAGLMEKEEEIENNLSLCYRCDTPIEPLPSLQWFINVNKPVERLHGKSIKETCQEAVRSGVFGRDKIRIIPERFERKLFQLDGQSARLVHLAPNLVWAPSTRLVPPGPRRPDRNVCRSKRSGWRRLEKGRRHARHLV